MRGLRVKRGRKSFTASGNKIYPGREQTRGRPMGALKGVVDMSL